MTNRDDSARHLTEILDRALGSGEPSPQRLASQRARLLGRTFRHVPSVAMRWSAAALVVLGLALVLLWSQSRKDRPTLRGAGQESTLAVGAWIEAPRLSSMEVDFPSGTRLVLGAGGSARLSRLEDDGVTVELVRGRLDAAVRGDGQRTWRVHAGPYLVTVVGTVFSVEWLMEEKDLRVAVVHGRVRVNGGEAAGRGVEIGPGQQLTSADDGTLSLGPRRRPRASMKEPPHRSGAAATPDGTDSRASELPRKSASSRAATAAASAEEDWRAPLARNDYAAATRAVERGLAEVQAEATADELWALANAARYARRPTTATALLDALRTRFPGGERAVAAAYLRGRLGLDSGQDGAQAAHWFRIALAEGPSSATAEDALAGLMDAEQRAGNRDAATRVAAEYLARYPRGTYAARARALVDP